jgi:hypothetical protein
VKLHSPKFEKSLRRSVRKTVRSSPELQREFKIANKYRKHLSSAGLVRPVISFCFAAAVCQMLEKTGHPASALALINLWTLLLVLIHAQGLATRLYAASDLPALTVLPIPAYSIFRWQLQKFIGRSLWSLFDLIGAYGALAITNNISSLAFLGSLPIAIATWVESLALAALCLLYLPRSSYLLASTVLILITCAIFIGWSLVGESMIRLIDACAPSLNLLLPSGWPVCLFQLLLPGRHWSYLLLVVPVGAIIWTLKSSLSRLRATYHFNETILPEPRDLLPTGDAENEMEIGTDPDRPRQVGPTAIEEIVQTRQFLAAPTWSRRGWFEGLLWNRLSSREKALSEFVFPDGLRIVAPWKKIFRNLLITWLASVAAKFISPVLEYWIVGIGLFVTICQTLAQILATGRAFQLVRYSGVNIPLYAGYAIGFRELAQFLIKCSLVQLPLLVPFAIASVMLVYYLLNLSLIDGAVFGLKAGGLLFLSRFIFITFGFSSGTNDTALFRIRSVMLIFFIAISGLAFAGLGGASLFVPPQGIAWLLWSLAALDAYFFFRVYGWFYHRNFFDLMCLPRI